jgi:glycosyltransferase involved in cell wall biosynthesis
MRILHVITTLDTGGAQMMLYKLLLRLDQKEFSSRVVSLIPPGIIGEKIQALGITVSDLGMRRGMVNPMAFFKLTELISLWKPAIIQTWMYHSDLLGLLAAKTARAGKVVWNIRSSGMDFSNYGYYTAWTAILCALLSRFPEAVITNSHVAKECHLKLGYRPRHFEVIPNGFDLGRFQPNVKARRRIRDELRLGPETPCIGLIARFDPKKDHGMFFYAIKKVVNACKDSQFVLCGDLVSDDNVQLRGWIDDLGIESYVHLLGRREDMPGIMAAMDVVVLSSASESFPNVVGEAMACGVPCVVTDVGDSARIVSNTGKVVPPKDPNALADAILELLEMRVEERQKLGQKARERIRDHYSLDKIVGDYEELYLSIGAVDNE